MVPRRYINSDQCDDANSKILLGRAFANIWLQGGRGEVHYSQAKHPAQDQLFAHGHLQTPQHGHRQCDDGHIHEQIEDSYEQI